jgi:hypothetical protein
VTENAAVLSGHADCLLPTAGSRQLRADGFGALKLKVGAPTLVAGQFGDV